MRLSVPFVFLLLLAACGESSEQTARCATCGMIVAPESGWRAGGTSASGEELVFDAPKCLFRHRHERGEVSDAWVIEYYAQERRPAAEMRYVIGSDLESPMGRDLVPIEGEEAAERFMADHHGEGVLTYAQVSADVVSALFEPRP